MDADSFVGISGSSVLARMRLDSSAFWFGCVSSAFELNGVGLSVSNHRSSVRQTSGRRRFGSSAIQFVGFTVSVCLRRGQHERQQDG